MTILNHDAGNPFESGYRPSRRNRIRLNPPRIIFADEIDFDDQIVRERFIGQPVEINPVRVAVAGNSGASEDKRAEGEVAVGRRK